MTRRRFLAAAAAMMTPNPISDSRRLVAEWRLNRPQQAADDSIAGLRDPIHARSPRLEWPAGPTGRALRLDGYSTWIARAAGAAPTLGQEFSLELWVALEAYPVSDAPFLNQHIGASAGWFFGLNSLGRWGLSVAAGGDWNECFAPHPFPQNAWTHLAATFDPRTGLAIFLNGVEQGRIAFPFDAPKPLTPAPDTDLLIGRHNRTSFADADVFATGLLNGLISEVRIYNYRLDPQAIQARFALAGKPGKPNFTVPRARFADDPQRPIYHAMPAAAWTNEPHGLIRWNGHYHLFFQQNPNGPYWGQIHWGHLESRDLVHWEPRPPILAPEAGTDQRGCWSGSALIYKNVPTIFYTGVDGRKASILLAQSGGDLREWKKDPANPVIPGVPEGLDLMDFRDPYVWAEGETLYAIIGTGIRDRGGAVLLYRSHDGRAWTFVKVLFAGKQSESGIFWEMPILVPVGGRHALIVCEMPGKSSYWVGAWQNETFTPDQPLPQNLDVINHMLSPTPFVAPDGRVTMMGISPDLRGPREAWQAGWRHLFCLPREVTLGPDGRLRQRPAAALHALRGERFSVAETPLPSTPLHTIQGISGDTLEIRAVFDTAGASRVGLRFRCSPDGEEETLLVYDVVAGRIVIDRSRSSTNAAVNRAVDTGPFQSAPDESTEMHIFLDRSMIDVFLNGREAFTTRIYPTRPDSTHLGIVCTGHARLKQFDVWRTSP